MTSIIQKRRSLHQSINFHKHQNEMLKMQVSQLHALANLGTSTCMIAHEINNLLTPLSNYAQLAINNPEDQELTEKVLQKTLKNCNRASQVMQSILSLANGETEKKQITNLKDLVEEIFTCLCRDFKKDKISVKVEIPDNLTIKVIPVQLQQVIMNLILNARDAMLKTGGNLTITASEESDQVIVSVSDTGCGIKQENVERIFEPFFSTKSNDDSNTDSGNGLGLSFCKKVVHYYNGTITVDSQVDQGTTFKISLPQSQ